MSILKIGSDIDGVDHLLDDTLVDGHRRLVTLACGFGLVNLYTVRKERALVLRTQLFK